MSVVQSIAVLGSTGSIGTSCLDVIRHHPGRLRAVGLSAHRSGEQLRQQVAEFRPDWALLSCPEASGQLQPEISGTTAMAPPKPTDWYWGAEQLTSLVRGHDVDTVLTAVVGAAGLPAMYAAVDAGKRVAIANKEALVIAGAAIMRRAAETGACLVPVDSEHSAIFQCLQSGKAANVRRIILTASGGPFRGWTREQMKQITPESALKHPTWNMGPKISIDSATMMNKALEIIEARWLFGMPASQISVVIHPQSLIHSFVEFCDGSVVSQISPPDMRLPIQYALTFPERLDCPGPGFNWNSPVSLELFPPDFDAFPALRLGYEAAERGGTCGAVLNAANEVAVARFLDRSIRFDQITQIAADVLRHHHFDAEPSIEQLQQIDGWARKEALRWQIS